MTAGIIAWLVYEFILLSAGLLILSERQKMQEKREEDLEHRMSQLDLHGINRSCYDQPTSWYSSELEAGDRVVINVRAKEDRKEKFYHVLVGFNDQGFALIETYKGPFRDPVMLQGPFHPRHLSKEELVSPTFLESF